MFTEADERSIEDAERERDEIPLPEESDIGGDLYERWLDRRIGEVA